VTTKDAATGLEKKEVIKVPVTKNKVVPKAAVVPTSAPVDIPEAQAPAVAQNSTHEVVPVTEIEEKEEAKVDPVTNTVKV